jgi:CHAT domain-containing protein
MNRKFVYLLVPTLLCTSAISCSIADARAGRSPLRQLARMQPQRSFAPRLSIPTRYRDCEPVPSDTTGTVPREDCGTSDERSPDLQAAKQAGRSVDPDSLQWSALTGMMWWDRQDASLNAAIDHLGTALRLSTTRVPLLVDLSAAHLVRAERTQNSRDLFVALNYAEEALAHEPRNPSAGFNAALALQAIGLDEGADRRWGAYLAMDSNSSWAAEARRRRRQLATDTAALWEPGPGASTATIESFAARSPQQAREYGFDRVLGTWGEAVEAGNQERADSLLRLAETLGRTLERRRGGDKSLADAVRAIREHPDAASRTALAHAHRAYTEGLAHLGKVEPVKALVSFSRVTRIDPPSSVLLLWTSSFESATRMYQRRTKEAERLLGALLPHLDGVRYPALAGRTHRQLGVALTRLERPGEGHAQFRVAARYLEIAGEDELLASTLTDDAEAAHALGDTAGAYASKHRMTQVLRRNRRSKALHNHLLGLGRLAALDQVPYAARAIYDEDVAVAGRVGVAIAPLEARLARAGVLAMLGDSVGARRDVAFVSARLDSLPPDSTQKDWVASSLRLIRPEGVTAAQIDSAVEAFAQNAVWLAPALLRRVDLRLAEGNVPGASADLQTLTEGVERLTWQENNGVFRSAIVEQARSLFDRLVMVQVRARKPDDALRALERGRMSFAPRRNGGVRLGEGRLAPPPGHVAVEYALIDDTLLIWTIGDSIRFLRQPVDRHTFMLAVEQANAALESVRAPIPTDVLQRLYGWLIRPIRSHLGAPNTPLVILADGEVAAVPFAALMNGDRYLVEDHPLRFAATLQDAARPAQRGSGPVLLVADPAFDPLEYATLDPLPGARQEVDSLVSIYPGALPLDGPAATRDSFLAHARTASVIHYAGHAVFDDTRPERSYLLLAGNGTTGRLTAEAVNDVRLEGTPLVVLSACSTLRSRQGRSGGFAGLSGALLAAGAGGVVGSLWQVNDQLTRPLMAAFHEQYQRGGDPASALRNAQLQMLRSGDDRLTSPAAWAGFRYTGS